jgi:hypothetical protein
MPSHTAIGARPSLPSLLFGSPSVAAARRGHRLAAGNVAASRASGSLDVALATGQPPSRWSPSGRADAILEGPSEASLLSLSVVSTYPPREMDLFLLSGTQCMKPCHVGKGGWRPPGLLKTNADVIVRVSRSIEGHVKVPHESSFSTINANLHFPPIHKILYVDSPGTILRNLASLCLLAICENPLQICGEIAGRASRDRTVVVRSVF